MRLTYTFSIIVIVCCVMLALVSGQAIAAEQTGEYLRYQEPQPSSGTSWLSMVTYVFSLIVTFGLVLALAYFTSRFLGRKMGVAGTDGGKVLATLTLGPNRCIYVVEIAGNYLVVGVTEHSINLLDRISDSKIIEKLVQQQPMNIQDNPFSGIFQKQMSMMHNFAERFPTVFNPPKRDSNDKPEKR